MTPLARFWGPDGDLYEVHRRSALGSRDGSAVEPALAARLVRSHLLNDAQKIERHNRALPANLADELDRGDTSRFVLRRKPRPRPEGALEFPQEPTNLADLIDVDQRRAPPEVEQTVFEMTLLDEMGEPLAGIPIDIQADGTSHLLNTDDLGHVKLEGTTSSFATAKIANISQLREAVRPRWETIREGPWVSEPLHHSYIECREPLPIITLRGATAHVVVVQPRVVCACIEGMVFDTSKAFLLPSVLTDIGSIVTLYEERPKADVLIVGHTDTTGDPNYNDPLSIERADSVRAFLRDDVDAWLDFYGSHISWEKKWGSREDNLMLKSILIHKQETPTGAPMHHFQATRGLSVDGVAGPETRRQLITEYMGLDLTTLPEGIEPVVHGCGENFPVTETGELDQAPADGEEDVDDRRVELLFFDGELGVLPPPPGPNSSPGSPEYPEWRRRAGETHRFIAGANRLASVRVTDGEREPIPSAPVRYVATGLVEVADDEGFIQLDEGVAGEAADLEWTHPGQEGIEPWPFSRRVFVHFPPGEQGAKRKLHNVGYLITDEVEANVTAYEIDFGFEPSGELARITPSLHAWHDGGERPDPNKPPAPPPGGGDPTKEGLGDKRATAAPMGDKRKLLVGVTQALVSKSNPLPKSEVSVDVVGPSGTKLTENKVLRDHTGGLVFQYLDVDAGLYDVTARRTNADGDLVAIVARAGVSVGSGSGHTAVTLVLGQPASSVAISDVGNKFAFDNFTPGVNPRVTVEIGVTDQVRIDIGPSGTFAQCTFEPDNAHCILTPTRATADSMRLNFEGSSKGITIVKVRRAGETMRQLVVKSMKRRKKRVAVRLVHETNFNGADVTDAEIKKALNDVFGQAMLSFDVKRLSTKTVEFDLNGDGTLDTGVFMNLEQQRIRDECKDDSFDFNLFLVAKPSDTDAGGQMGIGQRYGFLFADVSSKPSRTAAHEIGHGLGLAHVEDVGGVIAGDTDNLMKREFHPGTQLRHFQWDQIEKA